MNIDVKDSFDAIARERLGEGFVKVELRAMHSDGDLPVYELDIVYDPEKIELTAELMNQIASELWSAETESGGDHFPVPYFTDQNDYELNVA